MATTQQFSTPAPQPTPTVSGTLAIPFAASNTLSVNVEGLFPGHISTNDPLSRIFSHPFAGLAANVNVIDFDFSSHSIVSTLMPLYAEFYVTRAVIRTVMPVAAGIRVYAGLFPSRVRIPSSEADVLQFNCVEVVGSSTVDQRTPCMHLSFPAAVETNLNVLSISGGTTRLRCFVFGHTASVRPIIVAHFEIVAKGVGFGPGAFNTAFATTGTPIFGTINAQLALAEDEGVQAEED